MGNEALRNPVLGCTLLFTIVSIPYGIFCITTIQ